jgi:hypothetical protein
MKPTIPEGARPALRGVGHRLRRYVRRVWESRGGGFYGFIAAGTFLYLEATDLAGDVPEIAGLVVDPLGIIGFLIGNLIEAVMFLVTSAIWPLLWIDRFGIGLGSGALLGVGYLVYRAIHPTVRRWLADPEPEEGPGA